jgi:RNA polymerase sigma-70 factor, ECF subfamily
LRSQAGFRPSSLQRKIRPTDQTATFEFFLNEWHLPAFFNYGSGCVVAESLTVEGAIAVVEEKDQVETMVREYSRLVYRIAYSVLRNSHDAEDSTQETFLRVLRYGKDLSRISDRKAWIARIAWRSAVERRKQVMRSPAGTEGADDELESPGPSADGSLLEHERGQLLERMIAALPDPLRQPLVLSTLQEMSPREVAEVLCINEAAVRSRTFRARQILKEKLSTAIGPGK